MLNFFSSSASSFSSSLPSLTLTSENDQQQQQPPSFTTGADHPPLTSLLVPTSSHSGSRQTRKPYQQGGVYQDPETNILTDDLQERLFCCLPKKYQDKFQQLQLQFQQQKIQNQLQHISQFQEVELSQFENGPTHGQPHHHHDNENENDFEDDFGPTHSRHSSHNREEPNQEEGWFQQQLNQITAAAATLTTGSEPTTASTGSSSGTGLTVAEEDCQMFELIFSSNIHGVSLQTMLSRVQNEAPTLLVILDENGIRFGAFLSHPLHIRKKQYYGDSDCFLWSEFPGEFVSYPTTGQDNHYIFTDSRGIGLGGPLEFGLWIDSHCDRGQTQFCHTFENNALSLTHHFRCSAVEVYRLPFTSSSKKPLLSF